MYGSEVSFSQAAVVTIFSIAVVFLVLLLISYLIELMAALIRIKEKKSTASKALADQAKPIPPSSDPLLPVVLAAAAAYLESSSSKIILRKIKQSDPPESSWVQAARIQSMK